MRPSNHIVSGTFFGAELEPGVFHDELCFRNLPEKEPVNRASMVTAPNSAVECGTFCLGEPEGGVCHWHAIGHGFGRPHLDDDVAVRAGALYVPDDADAGRGPVPPPVTRPEPEATAAFG